MSLMKGGGEGTVCANGCVRRNDKEEEEESEEVGCETDNSE